MATSLRPFLLGQLLFASLLLTLNLSAQTSPRERLLLDPNWKFTFGDPADAGDLFKFPEANLDKQNLLSEKNEAELVNQRPDAVAANLGGNITYVQPDFKDTAWRSLDLPH